MKPKHQIAKQHEDFIRDNYFDMHDSEMAEELNIRPYYVHKFRIDNGLIKKMPRELRRFNQNINKKGILNVNSVENWLV